MSSQVCDKLSFLFRFLISIYTHLAIIKSMLVVIYLFRYNDAHVTVKKMLYFLNWSNTNLQRVYPPTNSHLPINGQGRRAHTIAVLTAVSSEQELSRIVKVRHCIGICSFSFQRVTIKLFCRFCQQVICAIDSIQFWLFLRIASSPR